MKISNNLITSMCIIGMLFLLIIYKESCNKDRKIQVLRMQKTELLKTIDVLESELSRRDTIKLYISKYNVNPPPLTRTIFVDTVLLKDRKEVEALKRKYEFSIENIWELIKQESAR